MMSRFDFADPNETYPFFEEEEDYYSEDEPTYPIGLDEEYEHDPETFYNGDPGDEEGF